MSLIKKYYLNKERVLGSGRYSKVYMGYNINTKKPCAIKKIYLNTDIKISYLRKEIEIMNNIKNNPHPNIVKCLDIYEEEDLVYIVLEYCNCGDLSKLIKMPIQEKFVKFYFRQFNDGIQYLRNNNLYHRDLKPKNILITDNFKKLKIADFGLADYIKDNKSICGSPLYMAPELLNKIGYSDKTDLWSIGLILYEMLYGVHPYHKCKKYSDLLEYNNNNIINIPPNLNSNIKISISCINLLRSLLKKKTSERITWDNFIKHNWFKNQEELDQDYELENNYDINVVSDISELSDSSNENNLFELELS